MLGADAPDLGSVGVQLTGDVHAYEQAKLRLLNGAHSALAYIGLLRGHATVYDAMQDGELAGFVERMMRQDTAPTLRATNGLDIPNYISALLARLRNPENGDELLAGLAARAALLRQESRGAHYRDEYPATLPVWQGRILWRQDAMPAFERIP